MNKKLFIPILALSLLVIAVPQVYASTEPMLTDATVLPHLNYDQLILTYTENVSCTLDETDFTARINGTAFIGIDSCSANLNQITLDFDQKITDATAFIMRIEGDSIKNSSNGLEAIPVVVEDWESHFEITLIGFETTWQKDHQIRQLGIETHCPFLTHVTGACTLFNQVSYEATMNQLKREYVAVLAGHYQNLDYAFQDLHKVYMGIQTFEQVIDSNIQYAQNFGYPDLALELINLKAKIPTPP